MRGERAREYIPEVQSNCMGYVLYRLGLQNADRHVDPGTLVDLLKKFEYSTIVDADILAILCMDAWPSLPYLGYPIDAPVTHVVLVESAEKGLYSHRPGKMAPIRNITLAGLQERYKSTIYTISSFRVKTPKIE